MATSKTPLTRAQWALVSAASVSFSYLWALFCNLVIEYMLLLELHEQVPAMRAGRLYDGEGRRIDPDDLSPEARQLLHDYRLVQYDLSVGQHWSQDAMFYPRSREAPPATSAAGE